MVFNPFAICFWAFFVFYAAARVLQLRVIDSINSKLPPAQQLSRWSGTGWQNMRAEYLRLNPSGRLFQWVAFSTAFAAMAASGALYFAFGDVMLR